VSRVAALFRYPVKGFAREECAELQVLPGGAIAGDRVLALRFNDSATPDDAWGTKMECIALINTPALTPLRLEYDHEALRLRVRQRSKRCSTAFSTTTAATVSPRWSSDTFSERRTIRCRAMRKGFRCASSATALPPAIRTGSRVT
jgi:uncharacterized protein YcbX